jgi:hypothetical protein
MKAVTPGWGHLPERSRSFTTQVLDDASISLTWCAIDKAHVRPAWQ